MTRFEHLVRLLVAFYHPGWQSSQMASTLAISKKVIVYQNGQQSYLEQAIAGAMLHQWQQSRKSHGWQNARGSMQNALVASEHYARYFYRVIFLDLASGVRATLNSQSWFESFSGACAIICNQLKQENTQETLDEALRLSLVEESASDSPSIFEQLVELQLTWVQPRKSSHAELIVPLSLLKRRLMEDLSAIEDCKDHSFAVLFNHWQHVKRSYPGQGVAYGNQREAQEHIRAFIEYWYEKYFQRRLGGSRANLSHDFPVFADGYAFVLLKRLFQQKEMLVVKEGEQDENSENYTEGE